MMTSVLVVLVLVVGVSMLAAMYFGDDNDD